MKHVLVYSDSASWGIIPNTRQRLPFEQRWPGVMEIALVSQNMPVRVIEDCLNGRRTVFDDPCKPGRNGLTGLAQRIEIHSPLALVILMLGANDFQSVHSYNAFHSSQGIATLVGAIRSAPIESGMPVPEILIVAPPPFNGPKGAMGPRFAGAEEKSQGLAQAYKTVAEASNCHFFDAVEAAETSAADGVHIDREQHIPLGKALAAVVADILATQTARQTAG